jgi:N-acetylneuraminate synthase
MEYKKPIIIAEIGNNHCGNMDLAEKQINLAIDFAEVDIVKFQKRCVKELLTEEEYNKPHPNPEYAWGETYGKHRDALELNILQHKKLKKYIEKKGKIYSTSVWDLTSAKEIANLHPKMIKIPSATNLNFPVYDYLIENYEGGEIHVSMGMTTQKEEDEIVNYFIKKNRNKDIILYGCTSGYPVPPESMCILEIERLIKKFKNDVKDFGFSNHGYGISTDVAIYTLGARFLERHFINDRTIRHTDAAASIESDGMRRLVRDLNSTYIALKYKEPEILPIEEVQRKKLKKIIRNN